MTSSEAVPYSKSGGLADVSSSLSISLGRLGHDVRIILPDYGLTDDSGFSPVDTEISVSIGGKEQNISILEQKVNDITVYLISHPYFTDRAGIYGDTSFAPYHDNLLRFTLMSKTAAVLCKQIGWIPDILHCHDWTTGFLPYLIRQDKTFKETKSVFTIHNLAYQGEFPRLDLLLADIPSDESMLSDSTVDARVNMMKCALLHADTITTVSPTYAKEIQSKQQGCGLDKILKDRNRDLYGILNGIDLEEWNPSVDRYLPVQFDSDSMEKKKLVKKELQKRFDLPENDEIPVISMVSRIAEQKGFYELCQGTPSVLEQILSEMKVQVLIVGTGDEKIEEKLMTLSRLHENLSVNLVFSNEAAHLVEGGSDFFLMPSRYEPCGLNQMYSMRYGTVVIARRTGGIADSVTDAEEAGGTGFLYDEISGSGIYAAVKRAVDVYYNDRKTYEEMRVRGMEKDFSWKNSAQEYVKVYHETTKG